MLHIMQQTQDTLLFLSGSEAKVLCVTCGTTDPESWQELRSSIMWRLTWFLCFGSWDQTRPGVDFKPTRLAPSSISCHRSVCSTASLTSSWRRSVQLFPRFSHLGLKYSAIFLLWWLIPLTWLVVCVYFHRWHFFYLPVTHKVCRQTLFTVINRVEVEVLLCFSPTHAFLLPHQVVGLMSCVPVELLWGFTAITFAKQITTGFQKFNHLRSVRWRERVLNYTATRHHMFDIQRHFCTLCENQAAFLSLFFF